MRNALYREISLTAEAGACLLCHDAPCVKACPHGLEVDAIIRSLRFGNTAGAVRRLPVPLPCLSCETGACMGACVKSRILRPVAIDEILRSLSTCEMASAADADLSITFCGIRCENPFFLSSSVVGSNYEMVARAFDMGWAGVAFKTIGLFVPDEVSPRFDAVKDGNETFTGFKNIEQISDHSLEENLSFLRRLKTNYPSKVIIASIMGRDAGEWTRLAALVTEAGADIIECNYSCPHMAEGGLGSDVGQDPELIASFTQAVKAGTYLPVLAKMTPNLGSMESPAIAAVEAGADGIAAINTIKSITSIDLDNFVPGPEVVGKTSIGGYSGKAVKPIALRFICDMKRSDKLKSVPVSGMGGITTWHDAAEYLSLGCENVQVTTAVMEYGYRIITDMIEGMKYYLASHGFRRVSEIVGRALPNVIPADDLERGSICYPKFSKSLCVSCGRCFLSCRDGGHQAIRRDKKTGAPVMNPQKCVGCHLCVVVCPAGAISSGTRVPRK